MRESGLPTGDCDLGGFGEEEKDGGEDQEGQPEEDADLSEDRDPEMDLEGESMESEEARKPKVASCPREPTKQERMEHEITHLPYRSWCPHCVRGKAKEEAHNRRNSEEDREGRVLSISMDYCYYCGDSAESEKGPAVCEILSG